MVKDDFIHIHSYNDPVGKDALSIKQVLWKRQRVSTIIRQFISRETSFVCVDGECVKEEDWKTTRLKRNSKVEVYPSVGFFWSLLFGTAKGFWATVAATAFNAAVAYGISYLGGKLLGPDVKEPKDLVESQNYGWDPHTIQAEGVPRPKAYGRNPHFGNVVGNWTDVNANGDEILYLILCYGTGPVEGRVADKTFIDEQPVDNYDNITLYDREGTFDQTAIFSKHKQEYRPDNLIVPYGKPKTITTPNNNFDDVEVTIEFPKGMWYYHKSGSPGGMAVGFTIEVSEKDEGVWTEVVNAVVQDATHSPIYKSYKLTDEGATFVNGTQYDIRVTKLVADSVERFESEMKIRSFREVIDIGFKRQGKVLLGIKAVGTEQFSGSLNIKSVWDDSICYLYDGADWVLEHTRNRAWIVFNILIQPVISGDGSSGDPYTIESYEGLNPSTQIDTAFFYEWAQWCDEQVIDGSEVSGSTEDRMTCDYIADQESDAWTVATELAKIGRCRLSWRGTVVTGWLDTPTTVTDMVTYKDIIENTWKNSWAPSDELAGKISVFFRDVLHNYKRRSIAVFSEDAGSHKRNINIEGSGCTSVSLATRIGNHFLERNEKIRNFNEFETGKIGVRWVLGDVLRVNHRIPDWGSSYRVVKKISSNTIEVERTTGEAELSISSGDALYVRGFDEGDADIEVAPYTVDSFTRNQITITGTWNPDVQTGWIVAVGSVVLRRIINKIWLPEHRFRFTVETYDSTVEDGDNETPELAQPDYTHSGFGVNKLLPPINVRQAIRLIDERILSKDVPALVSDIPIPTNIEWSGNDSDTIFWDPEDTDEDMIILYKGVNYVITEDNSGNSGRGGDTTDKFVLFDPNSSGVGFITTDSDTAAYAYLADGLWLMAINLSGVCHEATPMRLVHAGVLMAGTITADLGQIGNLTVGTLQIQNQAVTIPTSSYTAGAINLAVAGTDYTVQTVTFTSTGAAVDIVFTCLGTVGDGILHGRVRAKILRVQTGNNGTILDTSATNNIIVHYDSANGSTTISFTITDTPNAGSVTYNVDMQDTAITNTYIFVRSLRCQEVKK